jgi:hypothetical protein
MVSYKIEMLSQRIQLGDLTISQHRVFVDVDSPGMIRYRLWACVPLPTFGFGLFYQGEVQTIPQVVRKTFTHGLWAISHLDITQLIRLHLARRSLQPPAQNALGTRAS